MRQVHRDPDTVQ